MAPSQNLYAIGLDARIGLKHGWMVGASLPLIHRDAPGGDSNTRIGDLSISVWKSLMLQTEKRPSLVASLRYTAPTGDDFAEANVPLGNGFHDLRQGPRKH